MQSNLLAPLALAALLSLVSCFNGVKDVADDVLNYVEDKGEVERQGKLFAIRSQTTRTLLATTTVQALSTCITAVNGVACTGRRRKRALHQARVPRMADLDGALDSSQGEAEVEAEADPHRSPRKVLTIWTTGFTTFTVSSTSYFPGITISVSLACQPGNIGNSCFG